MYIFQVRYLIPYTVFSLTQALILKPLLRPDLNVSSGSSNGGRCVGMSCAHVTLVFVLIFSCWTVHCAFFVYSCFKPLRKREHPRNFWFFWVPFQRTACILMNFVKSSNVWVAQYFQLSVKSSAFGGAIGCAVFSALHEAESLQSFPPKACLPS